MNAVEQLYVGGTMTGTIEGRTMMTQTKKIKSDGSTAFYYGVPSGASELQHLIAYKNMNAQVGEIFRACYRYGEVAHSEKLRDAKKMKFYAEAEIERLEKYES